jgi:hypothetical protein
MTVNQEFIMTDESPSVPVDDKHFVGIGKMVFDTNAEWNIPHLHFMVDKTASGNFEATLLEFGLVAWSETQDGAIKSLVKQAHAHILAVLERAGFNQFIREVDSNVMDGYWKNYRRIEFSLAGTGKDVSHELDNQLMRTIRNMISEETKNTIREIARNNAEEIISAVGKLLSLTPAYLTYTEVGAAA